MNDQFFTQSNCDRCGSSLEGGSRKMSWFTEECLCESCSSKESHLRDELEANGVDTSELEGCGEMPTKSGGK